MKIKLSFKCPDVLDQLDEEEREASEAMIEKYVQYGEYVYIEFDTDAGTARVVPVSG